MLVKDQNDIPKDACQKSIEIITFHVWICSLRLLTLLNDAVMLPLQTKTISIGKVVEKILTMATFRSTIVFVIATLWGKAESVDHRLAGE